MVAQALIVLMLASAAAWLIERGVLAASLRKGWLVAPNQRSSHTRPTPGIGGIAFVIPVIAWCVVAAIDGDRLSLAIALAGGALAVLGFVDDLVTLPARIRMPVHVAAVASALWLLPLPQELALEPIVVTARWLVIAIVALGMVWLINLYNFMDGIDGFAAMQCLAFCAGTLLLANDPEPSLVLLLIVVAGTMLGFLWFNWAPARIFMGDVGSGFLGFFVGAVALVLDASDRLPFVATMLLLTGFWFDATYTLCVRIASRQRFAEPHRSHLYQKLAQRIGHGNTTLVLAAYAACWLLPLAWLCIVQSSRQWLWVIVAALPMLVLCVRFRSGLPEARTVVQGEAH
jgi:Fuc2NAc and GlcNAc transferase